MKYLLDTHVILWWLTEPEKITTKAHTIISDKNNKIYTSSISFWEIAIKKSLGRLTIPNNILELLLAENFIMLPLSPEEGLAIADLPLIHQDPFDRILVIQAKLNDLVLITHDKKVMDYPVIAVEA
jgi:PIN domain nuclease of toxin-antitoxin system